MPSSEVVMAALRVADGPLSASGVAERTDSRRYRANRRLTHLYIAGKVDVDTRNTGENGVSQAVYRPHEGV